MLPGSVVMTFLRGKKIIDGANFLGAAGDGKFLKRAVAAEIEDCSVIHRDLGDTRFAHSGNLAFLAFACQRTEPSGRELLHDEAE